MIKVRKWFYIFPFILTVLGVYAFMTCCDGMKNHEVACIVAYGTLVLALTMQWIMIFTLQGLQCKSNKLHRQVSWDGTIERRARRDNEGR